MKARYEALVRRDPAASAVLEKALGNAKRAIDSKKPPKTVLETFDREAKQVVQSNSSMLRDLRERDEDYTRRLDQVVGSNDPREPRIAAAGPALGASSPGGAASVAAVAGPGGVRQAAGAAGAPSTSGGPLGALATGGAGGPVLAPVGPGNAVGPTSDEIWAPGGTYPDPPSRRSATEYAGRLVDEFGLLNARGDRNAMGVVLDARADPIGAQSPALQAAARARLSALFPDEPPFTDPRDMRLTRIDHILNVRAAVQMAAPTYPNAPWYYRGMATIRRVPAGIGSATVTLVYDGWKWVDQSLGTNTGRLVGQDFRRASPSDASNTWGAFKASFTSIFGGE